MFSSEPLVVAVDSSSGCSLVFLSIYSAAPFRGRHSQSHRIDSLVFGIGFNHFCFFLI